MARIFFSFIPWILFFALFGKTPVSREIATAVALGSHLLFNHKNLFKRFVLDIGTAVFFVLFALNLFVFKYVPLIQYGYLLSSLGIAAIAWISLLIKKPFTLQYAKSMVPVEISLSELFLGVNYLLTLLWSVLLTAMAVPEIIEIYRTLPYATEINVAVDVILMIIGVWASITLPEWLANKAIEKRFNIDIKKLYAQQATPACNLDNFNTEKLVAAPDRKYQVVIVGAGPVGLTMGLLLLEHGVRALVIEKHPGVSIHPKARAISVRSMELFRRLRVARQIEQYNLPKGQNWFGWFETLTGKLLARVNQTADYKSISPCEPSTADQSHLEQVLLQALIERGGEVLFQHEFIELAQDQHKVQVTVLNQQAQAQTIIEAEYLVAADGAYSSVRGQLQIPMIGPDTLSVNCSAFCEINLDDILDESKRFSLGYFVRKDRPAPIFIAIDGRTKWVCIFPSGGMTAAAQTKLYTDDYVCKQIHELIGSTKPEIKIISKNIWPLGSQVANQFKAGRTLLAGDSIHRFSPTGGMGMNTALQDADNLAWKLASVIQGKAGSSLLDTYTEERRPSILNNMQWSLKNLYRIVAIQREIDADKLKSAEFEALVKGQEQHLNKSGLDLGVIYASAGIQTTKEQPPQIPSDKYLVNTYPGARFPHFELLHVGKLISSLDLVGAEFLLVCTPDAVQVAQGLDFGKQPVKIAVVGPEAEYQELRQGEFRSLIGVEGAAMALVRPDGHIAWRGDLSVDQAGIACASLCSYFDPREAVDV